jgi:hypothetical protein
MGWVSSCETGRIPRCRSSSLTRRQHPRRANGLRMRSLAQSETPCTWRRPLYKNLGGLMLPAGAMALRACRGSSTERSPPGRHEESDGCIVPMKPRTKPSNIGGGDGGGKAADRRKGEQRRMSRTQRRIWHVTEAASPRIGAVWVPNTPKADRVRPSIRARCVSSARRDLCGGRGVILVPTAPSDMLSSCIAMRW